MRVTWKVKRYHEGWTDEGWIERCAEAHGCELAVDLWEADTVRREPTATVHVRHVASNREVAESGLPPDVPAAKRRALAIARRLEREAAR